jgi:hypothetical protein
MFICFFAVAIKPVSTIINPSLPAEVVFSPCILAVRLVFSRSTLLA